MFVYFVRVPDSAEPQAMLSDLGQSEFEFTVDGRVMDRMVVPEGIRDYAEVITRAPDALDFLQQMLGLAWKAGITHHAEAVRIE